MILHLSSKCIPCLLRSHKCTLSLDSYAWFTSLKLVLLTYCSLYVLKSTLCMCQNFGCLTQWYPTWIGRLTMNSCNFACFHLIASDWLSSLIPRSAFFQFHACTFCTLNISCNHQFDGSCSMTNKHIFRSELPTLKLYFLF